MREAIVYRRRRRGRRPSLSPQRISSSLEIAGGLALIALMGWLLLSAGATTGNAAPTLAVMSLTAAAYALARVLSRYHDLLVPGLVVSLVGGFALLRLDVLFNRPLGGPLGYSNAAGSLFMLASAASMMVTVRSDDQAGRQVGLVASIAFAAVPWLNRTSTAALLVFLPAAALLASNPQHVRRIVRFAASAAGLAYLLVFFLGATYTRGAVPGWLDRTLSERRLSLWHDAISLTLDHPLTGVGPGRFPAHSVTAMADRDTLWPHDELLHFGAEGGLVALVLLGCIFAWAFARLYWSVNDRGTAAAAAALAAVVIHSAVDYVLHYPAVPMAAAAIVAAGVTSRRGGGDPLPRVRSEHRSRSTRSPTFPDSALG